MTATTRCSRNADVNGAPAYHDQTPIYDLVYWEVGGVVYSVESQGLTNDTSLGLAAALVTLTAPESSDGEQAPALQLPENVVAGETVAIGVSGVDGATLSADEGVFPDTGGMIYEGIGSGEYAWQAPELQENGAVSIQLIDPASGSTLAIGTIDVIVTLDAPAALALDCPGSVNAGEQLAFTLTGSGDAIVDAGAGGFPSDVRNVEFAPDVDGGQTMVGTLPESGIAALTWLAPEPSEETKSYLFATNLMGETTGECEIVVLPLNAVADEQAERVVMAAGSEPENAEPGEGGRAQSDPTEQPDAEPTMPANELVGIPTPAPAANGDDDEEQTPRAPSPTPNLTPTVRPTATIAPAQIDGGMAATIFGPDGGELSSPKGATVIMPPGALEEQSTVSIVPVADTKFQPQSGIELVPGTGFDVTIAGPNGAALNIKLSPPAELRIELEDGEFPDGAKIYRQQGNSLVASTNTRIEGGALIISVEQFSRFVVGRPVSVESSATKSLLPFLVGAVAVVIALVVMTVLVGMFRPRRQRSVMSRRSPRPRRRY